MSEPMPVPMPGDIAFAAAIMRQLAVPAFVLDATGRVIVWNQACERLTAMLAADVIGTRNHWRAFHETERPCLSDLMVADRLAEATDHYPVCVPSESIDQGVHTEVWTVLPLRGTRVYLEIDAGPVRDAQGRLVCVVETLRDMTLRESAQRRSRTLFEMSPEPTWILEGGKMVDCNAAAMATYRYESKEQFFNLHVSKRSPVVQPDGEGSFTKGERMMRLARENGLHRFEWTFRRADGTDFIADVVLATIDIDGRPAIYVVARDITDGKVAEERIAGLLEQQRLIFDNAHVGIILVRRRMIVSANQRQAEIFGFASAKDLEGLGTRVFYANQEQYEEIGRRMYDDLAEKGYAQNEYEMRRQDGKLIWIMLTGRPLNPKAVTEGSIWVYTDVTEAHQQKAQLELSERVFAHSSEALMITDARGTIVSVNDAFCAITGFPREEAVGNSPRILKSGQHDESFYTEMWQTTLARGTWEGEVWDRRKNGEIYPKWLSITVVRDAQGQPINFIGSFSDISARKAAEEKIQYLAHHDALTGLCNRHSLESRLAQSLFEAKRSHRTLAVMFIDLDRFKVINDTLGHHMGDMLLVSVAQRLNACVRESDIVARLGGDEFVVVSTGHAGSDHAISVALKILESLGAPHEVEGKSLHSTPSIGVAAFPENGEDADTLMKHADAAMYHAKESGRNNFQFYSSAMMEAATERMELERDMRNALQERQFVLHYQPQVDGRGGQVRGVEALVRWQHPQRGLVPPLQFIPIAEDSGIIEDLGLWVLDEACRQLAAWHGEGIHGVRMAINVSAHQLRSPGLVDAVRNAIDTHGLQPGELELEITESTAMSDPQRAVDQLKALRDLGVELAIDDFGTGYSSLAYLKMLPIQALKLDRAFVRDIETDENDAAISAATIALAHSLGLKVVAEGIETEGQSEFLARHGCDLLQGYRYGRPEPAAAWSGRWKQAAAQV